MLLFICRKHSDRGNSGKKEQVMLLHGTWLWKFCKIIKKTKNKINTIWKCFKMSHYWFANLLCSSVKRFKDPDPERNMTSWNLGGQCTQSWILRLLLQIEADGNVFITFIYSWLYQSLNLVHKTFNLRKISMNFLWLCFSSNSSASGQACRNSFVYINIYVL